MLDSCPYVHNYGLYKLISKLENLLELQILNCNEITQIDIKIPYLYVLVVSIYSYFIRNCIGQRNLILVLLNIIISHI